MHAFEFSYYTDSRACALNSFTSLTLHTYSSQFIYPSFLEGGGDGGINASFVTRQPFHAGPTVLSGTVAKTCDYAESAV